MESTDKIVYTKKTQLEHVLEHPELNVGSCSLNEDHPAQVSFAQDDGSFKIQDAVYPPGLFKICDEIISNAYDHYLRDVGVNQIHIDANRVGDDVHITVFNNGRSIPITRHEEYNTYIPSFIFGDFLSSSNYDKKNKNWIGTYGLGAKLANAFSKEFTVQIYDKERQTLFSQTWKNNMSYVGEPILKTVDYKCDFVQVSFIPDLRFFETRKDTLDVLIKLIESRAYELSTGQKFLKRLYIVFNKKQLPLSNFRAFATAHNFDKLYSFICDYFHVHIAVTENNPRVLTYINNTKVEKGTHLNMFRKILISFIETYGKVTPLVAKKCLEHLTIFLKCEIKDPKFDGQTKQNLVSKMPKGYFAHFENSKKDIIFMLKDSLLIDLVTKRKPASKITKSRKIKGIYKLTDAPDAGTPKRSAECTLVLTEGDSAKALAIAGIGALSIEKRRTFGVFPLKGKLLNVRVCTKSKIANNEEIKQLMTILGLKFQTKYESLDGLRYGKIMIMTDQDVDGFHIKGLIINFFSFFWPELLAFNMIDQFVTPIVKVFLKDKTHSFYDLPSYNKWVSEHPEGKKKVKYYKGLGTSTSQEAKEYFTEFDKHRIVFEKQDGDEDEINKAFSKLRTNDRKNWILDHLNKEYQDLPYTNSISYSNFINNDLVTYSTSDIIRSIPHFIDGLKPSQRKILYTLRKKKMTEYKVSQLVGSVMENTAYHHGEAPLTSTIIGMAQNFVGSNNINFLIPQGQFGTRLQGGNDAASARYIYTQLNPITNYIFRPEDDVLLEPLIEEEKEIEPKHYLPIIPVILVNGARGIGTGWSTYIPSYNPVDIIKNLRALIEGKKLIPLVPYLENSRGLVKVRGDKFHTMGRIFQDLYTFSSFIICDLPWYSWIEPYIKVLEELPGITFENFSTEEQVLFKIDAQEELAGELENKLNGFYGFFQLHKQFSFNNTYALVDGKPEKMDALEMLTKFYHIRLEYYQKRLEKEKTIKLERLCELESKKRFITEDRLTAVDKKKAEIEAILEKKQYAKKNNSYDYLLQMPFISLTQERVLALSKEIENIKNQLKNQKTAKMTWLSELSELSEQLKMRKTPPEYNFPGYGEIPFITRDENRLRLTDSEDSDSD